MSYPALRKDDLYIICVYCGIYIVHPYLTGQQCPNCKKALDIDEYVKAWEDFELDLEGGFEQRAKFKIPGTRVQIQLGYGKETVMLRLLLDRFDIPNGNRGFPLHNMMFKKENLHTVLPTIELVVRAFKEPFVKSYYAVKLIEYMIEHFLRIKGVY